jgi:hypothetical protein
MLEPTLEQRTILEETRRAKEARAGARARIIAENAERLARGLREADDALNRKVREAFEAGVSKRQIARLGLGTVDPNIVNRILEKTAAEAAVAEAIGIVSAPPPVRELTHAEAAERGFDDPDAELIVELHYPRFPTTAKDPNYPDPLCGVLKRVFGLWSIVEDPTDGGVENGWLQWELEEYHGAGGVLKRILDAYADKATAVRA